MEVYILVLLFITYSFIQKEFNLIYKKENIANDTTIYSEISTPSDRVKVAVSLNRDLPRIQTWCSTWDMKLNPNKTHLIIVSRSRTALQQYLPLSLCRVELETSTFLKLLGIVLDNKLTFEMHIRNISNSIPQRTGLICKCFKTLGNDISVLRSFYVFILPCFEYCSPVCCFGFNSYLRLQDCFQQ